MKEGTVNGVRLWRNRRPASSQHLNPQGPSHHSICVDRRGEAALALHPTTDPLIAHILVHLTTLSKPPPDRPLRGV